MTIRKKVTRADFERWIAEEIASMSGCVDRLMAASGLAFGDIDRVFLTGGSSFVPAVRRIFVERFGGAEGHRRRGADVGRYRAGAAGARAVASLTTRRPDVQRRDRKCREAFC